jgi:hypothetical protein
MGIVDDLWLPAAHLQQERGVGVAGGEPRAMLPAVSAALPQVAGGQPGPARPWCPTESRWAMSSAADNSRRVAMPDSLAERDQNTFLSAALRQTGDSDLCSRSTDT